jgi:hypothetical protein
VDATPLFFSEIFTVHGGLGGDRMPENGMMSFFCFSSPTFFEADILKKISTPMAIAKSIRTIIVPAAISID